jgi:hypothetical protein
MVCKEAYMENGCNRSDRAMATRMGCLLLNYVGKTFATEKARYILRKSGNTAQKLYVFEKVEDFAPEKDEVLEMVSGIFNE